MRPKVAVGVMVGLALVFFVSIFAVARARGPKILCVSKKELKGEVTLTACLEEGDRLAVVDQYGIVHILTPEEAELTKAFNPKAFETKAFGIHYQKLAPPIPPLP